MVFNATFNNISVISWWSVLLVEETGVRRENHKSAGTDKLYHIMLYTLPWAVVKPTTSVMIALIAYLVVNPTTIRSQPRRSHLELDLCTITLKYRKTLRAGLSGVLTCTKVWITLRAGMSGVLTRTKVGITLRNGLSGVLTRTQVWKKITSWNVWFVNTDKSLEKNYELECLVC